MSDRDEITCLRKSFRGRDGALGAVLMKAQVVPAGAPMAGEYAMDTSDAGSYARTLATAARKCGLELVVVDVETGERWEP